MPRVHLTQSLRRFRNDDPETVAIDTETTGVEFFDTAFCATLAWRATSGELISGYCDLPRWSANLSDILQGRRWVFHNAKFDLQKLILADVIRRGDIDSNLVEDTEGLAHFINENRRKGLKSLAESVLGMGISEEKELRRVRRRLKKTKNDGYSVLPSLTVVPYAIKDAEFTLRLYERFITELDQDVLDFYRREMELLLIVMDMEAQGTAIDEPYVREKVKYYNGRVLEMNMELEDIVGKPLREGKIPKKERDQWFNPNAPDEILNVMRERGHKIDSTKEEIMGPLGDAFGNIVLERRSAKKIVSSWLEPLLSPKSTRDGIYHGNFRPFGTKHGRFSSGKDEE